MKLPLSLTPLGTGRFSRPAAVVLVGFMAVIVCFFILSFSQGIPLLPRLLVSAWILSVFVLMLFTGRIAFWRRVFFVSAALLFFPSFIALAIEARGSMMLTEREILLNRTPFCPIVIPQAVLPAALANVIIFPARLQGHFAAVYPVLVIWLIASLTLGRGWCSWACFYGGWDDACSRLAKKPLIFVKDPSKRIRYAGFAVLMFVVLASLATFSAVYCAWLCPFKIVTEFAELGTMVGIIAFIALILSFFGFAVILPLLTRKRVQCMSLCPLGAFQSLIDRFSPYRVRIDTDACNACLRCVDVCPTLSIAREDIETKKGTTLITCTKCGECIAACPRNAIRYEFRWVKSPRPPQGLLAGWKAKLGNKGPGRALKPVLCCLEQVLSARALFVTSGMTVGTILTSRFMADTLNRIINLFVHGSFLLQ